MLGLSVLDPAYWEVIDVVTTSVDIIFIYRYSVAMAPIKSDQFAYAFRPGSIDDLRKQVGLTQAELAAELDVPVNTVSRWETGATTPDAKALAAMYSVAKERGINPHFFQRRIEVTVKKRQRTKLMVAWDFQNRGFGADDVVHEWPFAEKYLDLHFPKARANRRLRAYPTLFQDNAREELDRFGFEITQSAYNADSQIVLDVKEYCLVNPSKVVFVLISDDGDFVNLLRELRQAGVDCYVWGSDKCSQRLIEAVDEGHFLNWDKLFVLATCVDVIKELDGQPITRADFGQRCKQALADDGIYPDDVGFSKNRPYASLLKWLELQQLVHIRDVSGKSNRITIRLETAA